MPTWNPEVFDLGRIQNYILLADIARAYQYIEDHARYSISGDLEGFMFELVKRRWNLACNDMFEQPPRYDEQSISSQELEDIIPELRSSYSLSGFSDIPLSKGFQDRFVEFAQQNRHSLHSNSDGKLYGYGTDGFGTYVPLHLLWPELRNYWGIYISEIGVYQIAARLYDHLLISTHKSIQSLIQIAYQIVLRHELFHFKIEQWALMFELASGRPSYLPYLANVYLPTIYEEEDNNLEEALANASVLLSKKIKNLGKAVPGFDPDMIGHVFLKTQGPSYRNYGLQRGFPQGFLNLPGNKSFRYRDVVNYLCNQIISGSLRPSAPLVPYYLYPPNNNFLRAENLCPIYLVRQIPYESSVIALPIEKGQ